MVSGHGHPYGYPSPLSRYMDIRADIRVELSATDSSTRVIHDVYLIQFWPHLN